jgi:hypothetical protein
VHETNKLICHSNLRVIMNAIACPTTTPKAPRPPTTSVRIKAVLMVDWHINVILLSSIRSMPMKAAWAVFRMARSRLPATLFELVELCLDVGMRL